MIADFHSHILPGVDDGSSCVEESLALLRMESEQGIRKVVATPHFDPYRDKPDAFLKRRDLAYRHLREKMGEDLPQLYLGAEVRYFPGIGESDAVSRLTIAGTAYVLVEMLPLPWSASIYRDLENLHGKQGLTPVIAHMGRYLSPLRTFGVPEQLRTIPVLVQANAAFFLNRWTAPRALRMLKNGQIHLLGSDCHDRKHRPPQLGKAADYIEKRLGSGVLLRMEQLENRILSQSIR